MANAVDRMYRIEKRDISGTGNDKNLNISDCKDERQQVIKSVKPYSAIPSNNRHWILNVLEIFFTNGGIHKSLYKIRERAMK